MTKMLALFGPLSSASPDGIGPFGFLLMSLFALFLMWTSSRLYLRRRLIHRNAANAGYAHVGDRLPSDLDLGNSSLRNITKIENAFAGEARGKAFVFFDCTLGSGKSKTHRTVFAIRGPRNTHGAERFDTSLIVESVGSWILTYRSGGLITPDLIGPEEIQAFIAGL